MRYMAAPDRNEIYGRGEQERPAKTLRDATEFKPGILCDDVGCGSHLKTGVSICCAQLNQKFRFFNKLGIIVQAPEPGLPYRWKYGKRIQDLQMGFKLRRSDKFGMSYTLEAVR